MNLYISPSRENTMLRLSSDFFNGQEKPSRPRGGRGPSHLTEVLQKGVELILRGLTIIHTLGLGLLIVFPV